MSDIDVVADGLKDALSGNPDYEMRHMILFEGETYLMMLGPHGQHGWCWCQATMEDCPNTTLGQKHQHPRHKEWQA